MVPKRNKQDWFHDDGFPIVVERRTSQDRFGLPGQELLEIVIITGGKGFFVTGESRYELAVGDTFVFGGDRPHDYPNIEYVNIDQLQLTTILFDPVEFPLSIGDVQSLAGYHALFTLEPASCRWHHSNPCLKLNPVELVETLRMINELEEELTKRCPGFATMATAAMLKMVTFLARCYSRSRNSKSQKLLRIGDSVLHIQRNFSKPISLDELVELSGMSRRNFIRIFEESTGSSPISYLIDFRIREASRLLRNTERRITEIAFEVGFTDSNYFSRQFRKAIGISPRAYRNQLK